MLIIEGTDLIGKTWLCKCIVRHLNGLGLPWVYRHFVELPTCWAFPDSYFPHIQIPIVQDRFHLSEIAYRYARKEKQKFTKSNYRRVDEMIKLRGGFTVVLTVTMSFLNEQFRIYGKGHNLEIIQRANDYFNDAAIDICPFNPTVNYGIHLSGITFEKHVPEIVHHYLENLYRCFPEDPMIKQARFLTLPKPLPLSQHVKDLRMAP